MSDLLLKIHQVHDCLNIICEVESDIFDGSFRGLFRKKDYVGNEGVLQTTASKLTQIHDSLKDSTSSNSGIQMVIDDLINYSYALTLSTMQLFVINRQLADKAGGKAYSMGKYNEDVDLFKELQENYMSIGKKLNADYTLYSYDIAMMEG
jgi:hypothetical protein